MSLKLLENDLQQESHIMLGPLEYIQQESIRHRILSK